MPAVPKRFIITYLLAFALLCSIGLFYTARVKRVGWASLPFDPQIKVTPFWDQVTVFLLQSSTGDSFELVLQTDWERDQDYENHPDRYDDPRYVGHVEIIHTMHNGRVVAPFAHQIDNRIRLHVSTEPSADIPDEVISEAKQIAYEAARVWFITPFFTLEQLESPTLAPVYSYGRPLVLPNPIEFLVPPWIVILAYGTAPLILAWSSTVITTRGKSETP